MPSKTRCRLLELPAELRNTIYEHTIASHDSIKQPSLVRTCRKIRNEALDLFYSAHIFHFKTVSGSGLPRHRPVQNLLDRIPRAQSDLINRIRFDVDAEHKGRGWSNWTAVITMDLAKHNDGTWAAEFSRKDVQTFYVEELKRAMKRFNDRKCFVGDITGVGELVDLADWDFSRKVLLDPEKSSW